MFNVRHAGAGSNSDQEEQSILLSFLPFSHTYGLMSTAFFALGAGMQIVTLPRFSLKEVLSCIEKYKVNELFTCTVGVGHLPTLYVCVCVMYVCIYVCQHSKTKTTEHIITKLDRRIVHDKSWSPILYELNR